MADETRRIVAAETRYADRDTCMTAEQMTKLCCEPTAGLECCERGGIWDGYSKDEVRQKHGFPEEYEIRFAPRTRPCGRWETKYDLSGSSCCDKAEPLELVYQSGETIGLGGCVMLKVKGDIGPLKWTARGGYRMIHDYTGTPGVNTVCADDEAVCGNAVMQVEGGCGRITIEIPLADELPEFEIVGGEEGLVVAPDSQLLVEVSGGVPPFNWSSDVLELVTSAGRTALFYAPEEFCGSGHITVSDGCGDLAGCVVRSTEGYWETLPREDRQCDCAAMGGVVTDIVYYMDDIYFPKSWYLTTGEYRCLIRQYSMPDWQLVCFSDIGCGPPNKFNPEMAAQWCQDYVTYYGYPVLGISGNCCEMDRGDLPNSYASLYQEASTSEQWVCA